jgi:lysine-specific demethylase 8
MNFLYFCKLITFPSIQCVVAGHRTVPVEIGKSYLSEESGTQLMTMQDFVEQHILSSSHSFSSSSSKGYLAQHELFAQIPLLKADIIIPDNCSLLLQCDEDVAADQDCSQVILNAWFGPQDTISPLHFDCYYNLLAQVVGKQDFIYILWF